MRYLILSLAFLSSTTLFAQNEKGCGVYSTFNIRYGLNENGQGNYVLSCSGDFVGNWYCANQDTIEIILKDDEELVEFDWTYTDEFYGAPLINDGESLVVWYKNDSVLSTPNYSEYHSYTNNGPCGDLVRAGTTLETNEPGTYELRSIAGQTANLPIVVLREEQVIEEDPGTINISVFPNPAQSELKIWQAEKEEGRVTIHNLQGQFIGSFNLSTEEYITAFQLHNITSGTYVVTVTSDYHGLYRTKIVVI